MRKRSEVTLPATDVREVAVESRPLLVVCIHETDASDIPAGAIVWIAPDAEETDEVIERARASYLKAGAVRVLTLPRTAGQSVPTASADVPYEGPADVRSVVMAAVNELPPEHRASVGAVVEQALAAAGL